MSYIEENAYEAMENIFSNIAKEEEYNFERYFAADMVKVNKKDCVYPCFWGFNSTSIAIVKINFELEKVDVNFIQTSGIKDIKMKRMFLSKSFYLTIECDDNTSFTIGVPYTLKYIHSQNENVEEFLKQYPNHR